MFTKIFFSSLLSLSVILSGPLAHAMMLDEFLADPANRAAYENFPDDVKAEMQKNDELLKAGAKRVAETLPAGLVMCDEHYTFGSVEVELEPVTLTPVPGSTLDFSGTIKNINPYPIVSGTLFVKIFRQTQVNDEQAVQNGYPLVDQFIAANDIVVPAKGTSTAAFSWAVPANLPGGEYYAAFYFSTHNRYNLAGIMFMDDITGNQVDFTVTDNKGAEKTVALDRNGVSLNGLEHNFSQPPRLFDRYEPVEVAVTVVNPRDEDVTTSLTWTLSPWGDLLPERMINTKTVSVTLKPKEEKVVTYVVEPHDNTVSYVVAELTDGGVKSIENIRFVRDSVPETRLEFPTIIKYPLVSGEENGVFTCVHSTNEPLVDGNEVKLTLKDSEGGEVFSHTYTGAVPVDMAGVLGSFMPDRVLKNFSLEASLVRDGKVVERVKQEYRCADLGYDDCTETEAPVSVPEVTAKPVRPVGPITALLVILIGGTALFFLARKLHMKHSLPGSTLALLLATSLVLLSGAGLVEAKSQTLSFSFHNDQYGDGSYYTTALGTYRTASSMFLYPTCTLGSFLRGDGTAVYSVNVINKTTGAVIADGATIAVGTPVSFDLQFQGDFDTKTVTWGSMSGCYGSPTGAWVAGAARTASTPLSVNPPTINVIENSNGNTIFTCTTQTDCVIGSAGAAAANITFSATYGRYYRAYPEMAYDIDGNAFPTGNTLYEVLAFPVAATSIPMSFTAVVPNNAPTAPTITGPATGTTGSPVTFSFTATDSDGDQVRYGIDWDNNGTVDVWAPSSGRVNSGVASSATYTWPTAGTFTFRARTEDDNGTLSGWSAAKTVTVSNAPSVNLNFQ